jgi:hypothetical protein
LLLVATLFFWFGLVLLSFWFSGSRSFGEIHWSSGWFSTPKKKTERFSSKKRFPTLSNCTAERVAHVGT